MNDTLRFESEGVSLEFAISEERIYLVSFFGKKLQYPLGNFTRHTALYLFNDRELCDRGGRYANTGKCGEDLLFSKSSVTENEQSKLLCIEEKNEKFLVKTYYEVKRGARVLSVRKEVTNLSEQALVLDSCSAFMLNGLFDYNADIHVYKPYNSNYNECQWRRTSLQDEGVFCLRRTLTGAKAFSMSSNGSQASKKFIPIGIMESGEEYLFWQIQSDGLWHYETGYVKDVLYSFFGGGAYSSSGYLQELAPAETYKTVAVQLTLGDGIDGVVRDMTDYRRLDRVRKEQVNDRVIFNEFMHLSWDSPQEDNTQAVAKEVAKYGVDYYVIDADWHDETSDTSPTHHIGNWRESKTRFPSGVKKTLDYMRGLGLKVGLWIEIQSVGVKCSPMPLPDECFFMHNGKKLVRNSRYHLDFSNPKTVAWADGVLDRVLGEYQIDYLKIDYNQSSLGSDTRSISLAGGLEKHTAAYIEWYKRLVKRYPNVVFESCASGGQSIDALNLSVCDLMSTSDQDSAYAYAYISANITSAILPEQAAVWCYPLSYWVKAEEVTLEEVALNFVNTFGKRMHLASRFFNLTEAHCDLVREGLAYYKRIAKHTQELYPIFPAGFARIENPVVLSGFRRGNTLYLAVYNLAEQATDVRVDLQKYGEGVARVAYPLSLKTELLAEKSGFTVKNMQGKTARFVEYELK